MLKCNLTVVPMSNLSLCPFIASLNLVQSVGTDIRLRSAWEQQAVRFLLIVLIWCQLQVTKAREPWSSGNASVLVQVGKEPASPKVQTGEMLLMVFLTQLWAVSAPVRCDACLCSPAWAARSCEHTVCSTETRLAFQYGLGTSGFINPAGWKGVLRWHLAYCCLQHVIVFCHDSINSAS